MPGPGASPLALLKDVSRSFYLTLRVLPGAVRPQIGLAYLLARSSDTIADTELVAADRRLQALNEFRERVAGRRTNAVDFGELAQKQGSPAERSLLERAEQIIASIQSSDPADQRHICAVIETIISGQELDLRRFAGAAEHRIAALETDAELADYTYRVAGCVGEFWTRICRAHLFPNARVDEQQLFADAVRFGQGLQLVNILRDLPRDLRQGRCYIPRTRLASVDLAPEDLLHSETEPKFRALYDEYLAVAESHLAAGWRYTNSLPRNKLRVRLACAWPILIGMKTLGHLRRQNPLDPAHRIKVSHSEVRQIMVRSVLGLFSEALWQKQFEQADSRTKAVASNPLFQ
jgi:farnesyl-diphosphate farnesyltransferase